MFVAQRLSYEPGHEDLWLVRVPLIRVADSRVHMGLANLDVAMGPTGC